MNRASSLLLRLVGLATLLLVTVTRASSDVTSALTSQEEAICGTLAAPVPQFAALGGQAGPLRVVAIGSSSTYGMGASSPAHSYVSQLASQLKTAWPTPAEVFNRGVNGDTLADIVKRAPRDLYALKPNVVILQTGTNDALRNVPAEAYQAQLQGFVTRLQERHIGVILVDNQYLPAQAHAAEFQRIQAATHAVARLNHVALVSRYGLSETLQAQMHMGPEALLAADGLHPNDTMHACTAKAIEATMVQAFGADTANLDAARIGTVKGQPAS